MGRGLGRFPFIILLFSAGFCTGQDFFKARIPSNIPLDGTEIQVLEDYQSLKLIWLDQRMLDQLKPKI